MDNQCGLVEYENMKKAYAQLFSVANKMQTRGDATFKELTSRQYMAMLAIMYLKEEETTLNNIAQVMETTKQNANKLLNSCVRKGYVETFPNPQDGRSINVRMTPEGKKVVEACGERGVFFLTKIFREFTDEEVQLFSDLLQKLYRYDGEEMGQVPDERRTEPHSEEYQQWQEELLSLYVEERNKVNIIK